MDVILKKTLDDIRDTDPINAVRLTERSPIKQLIDDYQYYASASATLADYDPTWTGIEFKRRIAMLDHEQQLIMLYRYAESRGEQMDGRRDNADKRMRRTIMKVLLYTVCICMIAMVGAVATIAVRSGHAPSNEVVSAFFDTATKIAKLLFSNGGRGESF